MSSVNYAQSNTPAFYFLAWASFAIASIGTIIGLYYLEANLAVKGFFTMSYLFSVSSCFVVAKVIRDKQEQGNVIKRIEDARTEEFLSKYTDPAKL
ncbi:MAG: hypothetical protein H7Y04_13020 [Verrucomicrobia bacterium]|nr:hypothetical protein [Cytophagales bacterium]